MSIPRQVATWPRVPRTLQGMLDWAKALVRQMDLSLVHGAPTGLIAIDGVHFQEPLTATADPLVFTAPFDVAVQAPRATNLPDAPTPPAGTPLATVATVDQITGTVFIVPWSATYPPPANFWTLHGTAGEQTVVFGVAPIAPPVFLVAVLA